MLFLTLLIRFSVIDTGNSLSVMTPIKIRVLIEMEITARNKAAPTMSGAVLNPRIKPEIRYIGI